MLVNALGGRLWAEGLEEGPSSSGRDRREHNHHRDSQRHVRRLKGKQYYAQNHKGE